jgi:hypothetical protein
MNLALGTLNRRQILLAVLCLVLSCGTVVQARPNPAARLGRPFRLRVGQRTLLRSEGLRIRFVAVTEDSRCPVGVTCVWAGNAKVQIEVSTNRRDRETLTLNTAGNATLPSEAQYQLFRVQLVNLVPRPRANRKLAPRDYTLTLLVSSSRVADP